MKPAIVVTGASSGIGRGLARVAARDKSFMVLIGTSQPALDEITAELTARGAQAEALRIDLSDPGAGQRIEDALAQRNLFCDVLVNSAGFGVFGPAATADRDKQLRLIDVNARALTELTLRFLPGMVARGRGGILNVGSITAYTPGPYMAAYFASKAYVKSFTTALSAEVAGTGVIISCLNPGVVRTAFFERCSASGTRLFKLAPRWNVESTAAAGWRGFKAGKCVIIPRFIDRIIAMFCILLPDRALLRLISALQRPR
jgi:short-subunit dehydrogenase